MKSDLLSKEERFNLSDCIDIFKNSSKPKEEFRIGLEYERISVKRDTLKSVNYFGEFGMLNFLKKFAQKNEWEDIVEDGVLIGIRKGKTTITLEPGNQLEISLEAKASIKEIEEEINRINIQIDQLGEKFNLLFLEYGIVPNETYRSIQMNPKDRYRIMSKYFVSSLAHTMMRETAGIQVIFDYEDEEDAMLKFELCEKISPIVTAIFANSPIRDGRFTGFKSFRSYSWLRTDEIRCGFAQKEKNFSFKRYVDRVIKVPMLFIRRGGRNIEINGRINFENFMSSGFEGFFPTIEDFELHNSLYFPDVRLKNYIEIRNHDCQRREMKYAIIGLYKGLLSDRDVILEALSILKDFKFSQIYESKYEASKLGLDGKLSGYRFQDLGMELLRIAYRNLELSVDSKYLEPIMELTSEGLSPSDLIIKQWESRWKRDIRKMVSYVKT